MKFKEYVLTGVLASWAMLAPIHTIIYAVLALVGIDLLTGLWKAIRVKEAVTSRRLRDTIAKLVPYLLALLSGFAADHILGTADPIVTRVVGAGLALIEIKSVGENLAAITGTDLLAAAVDKLKPPPKE